MTMDEASFTQYEVDCIRRAAGRPDADVRPCEQPPAFRGRAYLVDGPQGGSLVKCLDAGYRNPLGFYLTLDHEAEGYRFFAGPADDLIAVPEVHFYESFPGPAGQELQVLGMTNLSALGATRSPSDVYSSRSTSPEFQKQVAGLCGRALARLVSTDFQNRLDRPAGVAAIRRQTERLLDHPERGLILDSIAAHPTIPWAYQNKVMGEMNVLLPRWLEVAGQEASQGIRDRLDQVGQVLTDPDVIQALSPAHSLDRILFSPRDRHDGSTLLAIEGGVVRRVYEIDMGSWGLETGGRLLGRYLATMEASGRSRWSGDHRQFQEHLNNLMSVFLLRFLRGDGQDSPDVVLRTVHVGLAGVRAAMLWLYMAALSPPLVSAFVGDALRCLSRPWRYLELAAVYARSRPREEGELVAETVEQVRKAMQPTYERVTGLLQSADGALGC
jgi:hypothetical protein